MKSPIDMMMDTIDFKCTVCGVSRGVGCGCWVTMRCPSCKKENSAQRHKTDPDGTAIVIADCPDCDKGHKSDVVYLDKAGQQVLVNE